MQTAASELMAAGRSPASAPRPGSPFDPANAAAYGEWRARKLDGYPTDLSGLMVDLRDPRAPTPAERDALVLRCRKANLAIYASAVRDADKDIPRRLGHHVGLDRLDHNWLADDDGISQVMVAGNSERGDYIPYTNRPIRWHTDGYYNPPERRICAMLLHCVAAAAAGGENALLDHEIAYLLLRDANPEFVRALMQPVVMTIPARTDDTGVARPAETGPVFSIDPVTGDLHMRYTARTRSIEWKQDSATREAVAFLERLLATPSPYVHRLTLRPGMGILSNNVLHDRAGFDDDPARPRLLYRARYYDRIAGTRASFAECGTG